MKKEWKYTKKEIFLLSIVYFLYKSMINIHFNHNTNVLSNRLYVNPNQFDNYKNYYVFLYPSSIDSESYDEIMERGLICDIQVNGKIPMDHGYVDLPFVWNWIWIWSYRKERIRISTWMSCWSINTSSESGQQSSFWQTTSKWEGMKNLFLKEIN